jgi:hypothetical protein
MIGVNERSTTREPAVSQQRLRELEERISQRENNPPRAFNGLRTFNDLEMERMKNFARNTLLRGERFNWRELLEASGKMRTGSGSIYEFSNMSTFDNFLNTCGLDDVADENNNRNILNELYNNALGIDEVNPNPRTGGRRRRKKSRKHKSLKRRRKSVRRR